MSSWERPEGTPTLQNSSNTDCPVCHGTGWELFKTSEGSEEMYGKSVMIEYARKCTRCFGRHASSFDETEVPDNMRSVDISKFKWDAYGEGLDTKPLKRIAYSFCNEFETWELNLKGLYLYSRTPGSGKTFLACCIAKSVMIRTSKRIKFITAVDYLKKVQDSFKRERGELDPSEVYRNCDLLILDDIGTQKTSEWKEQEMFRLINDRLTKNLLTIFTSNLSIDQLNVSERIKDRINKTTIQVPMPEVSVRKLKARQEQTEFLQKMFGGPDETDYRNL